LKGTNVTVLLQMVTTLVTAVIPGIRSTKQDNNSSKQLPFVRNENVCGSSLAGGRRTAGARHGSRAKDGVTRIRDGSLLTASLASYTRPGRSATARRPSKPPGRTTETPGSSQTGCVSSPSPAVSTKLQGCQNPSKQAFPWHEKEGLWEEAEESR